MNASLKTFFLAVTVAGTLTGAALAQDAVPTAPAAAKDSVVGISSRDGITLSGTGVLATRNGITEAITGSLKLTNGTTINPDGTIVNQDGTKFTMRPGQILTFDGQLINPEAAPAPAPAQPAPAQPAAPATQAAPSIAPLPAAPSLKDEE